jgi:2-keto-4-pentenoate hydratase/2-oxohepta-3-ene-1,7-dioic acid hydratase in catechol pathway
MFVRYTSGDTAQWGIRRGETIHSLVEVDPEVTFMDLASANVRESLYRRVESGSLPTTSVGNVDLLSPSARPNKIVVVGLNFADRIEEYDRETPEQPILYGKAASAIWHPDRPIVYPNEIEQLDYEVELAIVMGRQGRHIDASDAEEFVAGYSVVNDVSARDAHSEDDVAFRGNSYDTFAPLGPGLVPPDRIDPNDLSITLSVNGDTKQDSHTSQFIFEVEELIEFISGVMTLYPGDVICTGTPGGAGIYRDPPELLEHGNRVEATVESIGTLTNTVIDESELSR